MTKFVLEFLDESLGCVGGIGVLTADSWLVLRDLLDADIDELKPGCEFDLDVQDLAVIHASANVSFQMRTGTASCRASLRAWLRLDDLPYVVHTNRELALILAGEKPLAVFHEVFPTDPADSFIPDEYFAPYVESQGLVRREHVQRSRHGAIRYVLYATAGQQWRMDAYVLMLTVAAKEGWNPGFERMEGALLGYEDWQNDVYMEMMYSRAPRN
ncbi:hypothetical protein [Roseateles chitosanitabidus]|uniref:hypothetical protein n=1 Tax=Roseateles chitosanitabidus TaxID=65048 RepID=UPI0008338390|nr:hypothetical protein [Roseateles chitosanitabidus]